jgi:hypothetical protein
MANPREYSMNSSPLPELNSRAVPGVVKNSPVEFGRLTSTGIEGGRCG